MATSIVKLSLHLSADANRVLEKMCRENKLTKSDILRRSISLMEAALRYKKKGGYLVVVDDRNRRLSEIIGI